MESAKNANWERIAKTRNASEHNNRQTDVQKKTDTQQRERKKNREKKSRWLLAKP